MVELFFLAIFAALGFIAAFRIIGKFVCGIVERMRNRADKTSVLAKIEGSVAELRQDALKNSDMMENLSQKINSLETEIRELLDIIKE